LKQGQVLSFVTTATKEGAEEARRRYDKDGFTFPAMGRAPVGEKLALHASIGSFFWDGANMIAGVDDNVSDANIFFGVGLSVSLTNNTSIRGDAVRYELDDVNSNVYTVGFQIDFR
jgi:hypothetical protein